jgi:hypothetical protein
VAKRPPPYFLCIFFGNHYNITLSILGLTNICALEKSIFCCLLLGCPFPTQGGGGGGRMEGRKEVIAGVEVMLICCRPLRAVDDDGFCC